MGGVAQSVERLYFSIPVSYRESRAAILQNYALGAACRRFKSCRHPQHLAQTAILHLHQTFNLTRSKRKEKYYSKYKKLIDKLKGL